MENLKEAASFRGDAENRLKRQAAGPSSSGWRGAILWASWRAHSRSGWESALCPDAVDVTGARGTGSSRSISFVVPSAFEDATDVPLASIHVVQGELGGRSIMHRLDEQATRTHRFATGGGSQRRACP